MKILIISGVLISLVRASILGQFIGRLMLVVATPWLSAKTDQFLWLFEQRSSLIPDVGVESATLNFESGV